MSQQINLYQPIFRKEEIVFSAQTIGWLSLGLVVILVAWSLLVGQRIAGLEAQLERQRQAEQRAVAQIAELRESLPPSEPDPALEQEVAGLRDRREGLRESLAALERRMPAAQIDLKARLDALAREVPRGLWLTGVALGDQGRSVAVHGHALEARLVPAWLAELAGVELFSGLGFRQIHLAEREAGEIGVRFTISTEAEDES